MMKSSSQKISVLNTFSVPYRKNELERTGVMKELSLDQCLNDGKTLHELFMRGVRISGDKPCLGWRPGLDCPYKWITYNEVLERSQWIGSGLIAEGAQPKPSQFIGIMSINRVEHMLVKQACNNFSMVIVPIFPQATNEWIEYILELCELKIMFVDTLLNAKNLLDIMNNIEVPLHLIVVVDAFNDETGYLDNTHNVKIMNFSTLETIGKANALDFVPPKPEDLHIISFTCGTTGPPKGVMLTHKNFAVCIHSILGLAQLNYFHINADDVYFSFLPLSTAFESVLKGVMFAVGARMGFFSGNFVNVLSDVIELKPTIFTGNAQLIKKVYKANMSRIEHSFILSFFVKAALKAKMKLLNRGIQSTQTLWDVLVLKRIKENLGGKVKILLSSTKASNPFIFNFMKCVYGARTMLAYGSTETTSFVNYSHPLDLSPGSVGPPISCSVVKLIDAPKQKCFVADGIGEICVKGGNVFSGYYKDETLTNLVLDEDGWYRTGDIGTWLSNGSLKVIDRKQNVFIMTNGYKIFPEKIESILCDISFIHQIFVYGDTEHNYIVAVVIVETEAFRFWCSKKTLRLNVYDLFEDHIAVSATLSELKSFGRKNGLEPQEIPAKIFITDEAFTLDNGLLTLFETYKRQEIYLEYKLQLKNMLE